MSIENLLSFVNQKPEKANNSGWDPGRSSVMEAISEFSMFFFSKASGKNGSRGRKFRTRWNEVEFYSNNQDTDDNVIFLGIPAQMRYVILARLVVSGIGASLSLNFEDIEDLKIAITEAFSNVVKHAYPGDKGKGKATIVFTIHADKLAIVVADKGQGFDPKILKSHPHVPSVRGKGLGLFLIHSLVDEVEIHTAVNHGTEVRMMKYTEKGRKD